MNRGERVSVEDKRLIRLGEKYERIIERGGKVEYPVICSRCQKEECICEYSKTPKQGSQL